MMKIMLKIKIIKNIKKIKNTKIRVNVNDHS